MPPLAVTDTISAKDICFIAPVPLAGGAAFLARLQYLHKELLLQLPDAKTRRGLIHDNSNSFVECAYNCRDNDELLGWIDELSNICLETLIGNAREWFADDVTKEDVEAMYEAPYKLHDSGSTIGIRLEVPHRDGKLAIPVFDYNGEYMAEADSLDFHSANLIPLVHVLGLRICTDSISIVLKARQFMFLEEEFPAQPCMITLPSASPPKLEEKMTKESVDDSIAEQVEVPEPGEEEQPVQLKSPGQVYKELYEEALSTAKEKRDQAVAAFLEAEGIRTRNLQLSSDESMTTAVSNFMSSLN